MNNPFVKLWNDIEAEAAKDLKALEVLAVDVGTQVVATIEDIFAHGAPLAVAAILTEAPKVISGREKFGNAVTSVAQDLQVKLGPLVMADVQTLVQTAYTGLSKIAGTK
jgi:hypothetical protein